MHVEFRVSEVSKVCCLEPESFFRVKQLLAVHKRSKPSDALQTLPSDGGSPTPPSQQKKCALLSLYDNTSRGAAAQKKEERTFRPQLRVQFVLERVVKMETSDLNTRRDRTQHEKQVKSKWDGSEIRTQRFSAFSCEVLLASLPPTVIDCVVKIRLLQLPPKLPDNGAGARLDEAIGCQPDDDEEYHHDTPLCIGVSKITLKELMSVRAGVRMTLQAKRTITSLVEELNLNTIATNAMFGKDVGGSAFLTFQVVPYAFGKVPFTKLLLYRETAPVSSPHYDGMDDNMGSISLQSSIGGRSVERQGTSSSHSGAAPSPEQFETPAVRFMLVPCMALVDMTLRFHDAISWRRPFKTVLLLTILAFVMWADILDMALVLGGAVQLFAVLRSMSIFYHTPLAQNDARALVSPLTSARSPTVYLYGRQNVFLNTLVRCRLFFANGLQDDCFYEVALAMHLVRRQQRALLTRVAFVTLILTVISVETLFALILFTCFVLYPISLRLPNLSGARKSRGTENDNAGTLRYAATFFWRAYQLNRPMQISRVVKVVTPRRAPTPPPAARRITDGAGSMPGLASVGRLPSASVYNYSGPSAAFMHSLHARSGTNNTDIADCVSSASGLAAVSESSSGWKSQSTRGAHAVHRRAHTMDNIGYTPPFPRVFPLDGAYIMRGATPATLSFAIVSFTCDLGAFTDGGPSMSATTMTARGSPSGPLVARLMQQLIFAHTVAASEATGAARQKLFQRFFNETFDLLSFIRRNVTYQSYITPKSLPTVEVPKSALLRSETFVRPSFLYQQGADDSVTAALLSVPKGVYGPRVMELPASPGADNSARALALMAAAFLQGSKLSIYVPHSTSRNCSLIVPLCKDSDHIEQRLTSNPCPPPLFNALEEMWRNKQVSSSPSGMVITVDMVLQVISAYRNQSQSGSTLMTGSLNLLNNGTGATAAGASPDEPAHAATSQRRSFFQSLSRNSTNTHTSGGNTLRLSQTFYGTLPEGHRASGAAQASRENSVARLSRKGGSGADRSMPSSPILSSKNRQLSMQSSFEPPELKATPMGGDTSSPLRAGLRSHEEVPPHS